MPRTETQPETSKSETTAKFTRGPYHVEKRDVASPSDGRVRIGSADEEGNSGNSGIYIAHTLGPDRVANAHLLAAAPDLYAALEAMVADAVELAESGDAGFWDAEKVPAVIQARAALARARGEAVS